jgi:hypothetical protein
VAGAPAPRVTGRRGQILGPAAVRRLRRGPKPAARSTGGGEAGVVMGSAGAARQGRRRDLQGARQGQRRVGEIGRRSRGRVGR